MEKEPRFSPAIFAVFKPLRIERVVKQSDWDIYKIVEAGIKDVGVEEARNKLNQDLYKIYTKLQRDIDRGITLVPIPNNDPDHQ